MDLGVCGRKLEKLKGKKGKWHVIGCILLFPALLDINS